jgi:integrase
VRGYNKNLTYKKFKTKESDVDIIVLTRDELFTLYDCDLAQNAKLSNIRDVFCFACFTGQRYSDISKIRREDISGKIWYIRNQKTNSVIKIPLNQFAVAILEKYKEFSKPLPVISNQKSNEFVKEICKYAGLDRECRISRFKSGYRIDEYFPLYELVTTHTARRTFITLSLEKGIIYEVIMKISGHTDYKSLKKYIKISEKVVENEMARVWETR